MPTLLNFPANPVTGTTTHDASGTLYICIDGGTLDGNDAVWELQQTSTGFYDTGRIYTVGETCYESDRIYRCFTAVTSAEAFDRAKWVELSPEFDINEPESLFRAMKQVSAKTLNYVSGAVDNVVFTIDEAGHSHTFTAFLTYVTGDLSTIKIYTGNLGAPDAQYLKATKTITYVSGDVTGVTIT